MSYLLHKMKMLTVVFLGIGLLPINAGATALGDLREDIRLYRDGVEEIQQQGRSPEGFFLESMKKQAEYLLAFIRGVPPEAERLDKELGDFARLRAIGREDASAGENSARRQEEKLWTLLVEPYLGEAHLRRLVKERALLERRDYDFDLDTSVNFIEKPINDNIGFLQYRSERRWYRQQGIPKFEVTAGLEPFVLVENDNPLGVIADLGLLHHFFPEIRQEEDNRYLVVPRYKGWWDRQLTRYLRKVGFRVGAGALFDGPSPVVGAGVRLRSITIWGLYSSGDSEYSLAIGFSDFEWLKKINFVAPF